MTRTHPITIALLALFGGAGAWLLDIGLISSGMPAAMPPITLAAALAIIGALVVVLALPVRRAVRQRESHKVDPFYATRVVALAKASSIAGGLLVGAAVGILVFLLTRSVIAGVGSILAAVASVAGALVLLAGGLIAEYMCSIPPHDGDKGQESHAVPKPH